MNCSGLLSNEEVNKLKSALEHKDGVMSHMYHTQDAEQRKLTTAHWAQAGSDVTGVVARSEKIVQAMETVRLAECCVPIDLLAYYV